MFEKIRKMKIEGKFAEDIETKVSKKKAESSNGCLSPDQGDSCLNSRRIKYVIRLLNGD